jgi:hypothetical protein
MDCSAFRRHHVAYVDDTLPGDLVVAAVRHVAECPSCARHDTAVRRSLLLARNLARDAAPLECSADFGARLEARLAVVRAERAAVHSHGARPTPMDDQVDGYVDDWTPGWRELAAARVPSRLRTRPAAVAAAALLALTTGASFHSADHGTLQNAGAIAAAMAPFGSPFSPPPAPLAVAVEEPIFEPIGDRVVTWVTYDDGTDGGIDAGALVAPAATGVPVWAAAMLAGEAPAALWRAAGPRGAGRRTPGLPSVQLIGDVRDTR